MVTVHIKENNKQAKALLEMLKTFSFVEFEDPRYNATTEKAIKNAREGKDLHKVRDVKDLMRQLNS